jgi:hypothetical protein
LKRMWNALSAPPNDMIDRATSPEGVDRLAQTCCRNPDAWCCLFVTCTVAFTAFYCLYAACALICRTMIRHARP